MAEGIDGSQPIKIESFERASRIAEYEAKKAAWRGDRNSENNLRSLIAFLSRQRENDTETGRGD